MVAAMRSYTVISLFLAFSPFAPLSAHLGAHLGTAPNSMSPDSSGTALASQGTAPENPAGNLGTASELSAGNLGTASVFSGTVPNEEASESSGEMGTASGFSRAVPNGEGIKLKISDFRKGYFEDFESEVMPEGWEAYFDGAPVDRIRKRTPRSTASGVYSCQYESYGAGTAMGCLAKQGSKIVFGASFTNDTPWKLHATLVSFSAGRWNPSNLGDSQKLVFQMKSCAGGGIADTEGWIGEGRWDCIYPAVSEGELDGSISMERVELGGFALGIRPGETLHVRWVFEGPAKGKGASALVAVDDFAISFRRIGLSITVR